MHDWILMITSPFVMVVVMLVLMAIVYTIQLSNQQYDVLEAADAVASGMGALWIIVIALSSIDISVTCALLVQDRLFQFEFMVICFYSLVYMGVRFLRSIGAT